MYAKTEIMSRRAENIEMPQQYDRQCRLPIVDIAEIAATPRQHTATSEGDGIDQIYQTPGIEITEPKTPR
jgi:hypothetical protein